MAALRAGDASPLGREVSQSAPDDPLLLPGGSLGLIARATGIDQRGGLYGQGFVRAEADVDPDAWYLTSHFKGDEVMPGTLMYDGCLQTLRLLLLARGWLGPSASASFQPPLGLAQSLRCRGQVTPATKTVSYEVHVKETGLWHPPAAEPEPPDDPASKRRGRPRKPPGPGQAQPYALAEAIMFADGRPIVEVSDMGLRLSGLPAETLALLTPQGPKKPRRAPAKAPGPEAPPEPQPAGIPQAPAQAKATEGEAEAEPEPEGAQRPVRRVAGRAAAEPAPQRTVKVRRREGQPAPEAEGAQGSQVSVRRPAKGVDTFEKEALTRMSTGLLSEALGPLYARFDQGAFVARLPKAPYDFIDRAVVRRGTLGQVSVGTQVEATYNLEADGREWLLGEAGGLNPFMPYAAVNEMALQGCGFLAAYMGSALPFAGPMHFRNLGGEATVHRLIDKAQGQIRTRATLTKSSVLGSMTIQHYQFSVAWNEQTLYDGQTHFGFHAPESLLKPLGLKANPSLLKALTAPAAQSQGKPYPTGPAWPDGRWRMVDNVIVDPKGAGRVWGRSKVDPSAWFFDAHFPHDPVWPGSLGLEGFLQAAKALWAAMLRPDVRAEDLRVSWHAPAVALGHRWLYRGQIVPHNQDVTFGLKVTGGKDDTLIFKGLLWVDGQVVYQVDDFSVSAS
ncbi:MAG: hypothetical protein LBF58_08360 [Deltaproteobacteria bacterium]|nr:hypothetical protein [Deltaproteobacteria bacterium]